MNAKTLRQLDAPPTLKGFAAKHSIVTSADATEINDSQKAILRTQIEDFDALTDAREAAAHLAEIIEAEERAEININPADVKVHDDCTIEIAETSHGLSDVGFSMFARAIGPSGSASYLRNVDVDLRAHNMRALLAKRDAPLKLRTRKAVGDGREIFSIVTHTYPTVYASDVLRKVATRAAVDAKGLWTYDPNSTRVSFKEMMRQEINPHSYRHSADDIFQVGREWSLRDDGASSVRMALLTFRQACANMLMLSQSDAFIKRVRHRGDRSSMMTRVDNLFSQTAEFTRLFSQSWSAARSTKWCADEQPSLDVAVSAYGLLLNQKHLPPSKDADMLAADLGVAWLAEPGNTVADLVNGATRYARTLSVTNSDCFRSQELEAAAGNLLALPAKTWEAARRL